MRWWLGLLLLAVGLFLLGNTGERLRLAWTVAERVWPWALLALAVLNLLRAVFRLESALAPGLLAFVAAVALAVRYEVPGQTFIDLILPAVVAMVGVALLRSGGRADRSWTRVLITGRVEAPAAVDRRLRPSAVLCELHADLRPVSASCEVWVTAFFGHVRLTVPKDCYVNLNTSGTLLTSIRDPERIGHRTKDDRAELNVRVWSFCGVVSFSGT